jgi:aldehyde dehydrogenase (NAD+)
LNSDEFLIGGEWCKPHGHNRLDVFSPSTEERIGSLPLSETTDVDAAVSAARVAFDHGPWARIASAERGKYLIAMSDYLVSRAEEIARTQVDEVGSPYSLVGPGTRRTIDEIPSIVAEMETITVREERMGDLGPVLVLREPVGVVAGVVPWNAPFAMLLAKVAPALLAGCTVVIKPVPEAPLASYALGDAAVAVGLPLGVLSIVPGGREVGEHLVTHPGVDRVSFTGSTEAGARVASLCGQDLKRISLELGGKSAAIVLPDADLNRHLPDLFACSMSNTGQMCHATTRILVPHDRAGEIVDRMAAMLDTMPIGDPHLAETSPAPLISSRQRDRVEGYIRLGVDEGAKIAIGGRRPRHLNRGSYVEPTVFTNVDNRMRIAREEIFGPVVGIIEYHTEQQAVDIANDSPYGLGGAVFTTDVDHGVEIASRIRTGTFRINDAPGAGGGGPFGGFKRSGVGRERGREGLESFLELKSIALPPAANETGKVAP